MAIPNEEANENKMTVGLSAMHPLFIENASNAKPQSILPRAEKYSNEGKAKSEQDFGRLGDPGGLGAMGLATLSEGSHQRVTIVLQAFDPAQAVTHDDLGQAVIAVAVNAGSLGAGKVLSGIVSKGIADRVAAKILGEIPNCRRRVGP